MGRKAPRKRLVRRVMACRTGAAAPERFSALRPPLDSGWRSKVAKPGRKNAPREREWLFDIVRRELSKTVRRRAADSVAIIVPSPRLRGEGNSVLPRATMGEGVVCRAPLTHSNSRTDHCALSPQAGRGHEKRQRERSGAQGETFTIARAECFAKQSCGFCLFSSCSALLSRAKSGDRRDAGHADFPVYILPLTGKGAAAGCGRPPVFPP